MLQGRWGQNGPGGSSSYRCKCTDGVGFGLESSVATLPSGSLYKVEQSSALPRLTAQSDQTCAPGAQVDCWFRSMLAQIMSNSAEADCLTKYSFRNQIPLTGA